MKLEWLNDATEYISTDIFVKHSPAKIPSRQIRQARLRRATRSPHCLAQRGLPSQVNTMTYGTYLI